MRIRSERSAGLAPLLLVSVRNAAEAADALAGGADVIDIKEPSRGPLGVADREQIESILQLVNQQRPVSIAAGELLDVKEPLGVIPDGTQFIKFGLSRCARIGRWHSRLERVQNQLPSGAQIVPVAYADWLAAEAPSPGEVLKFAADRGCPILLVDTFDKRGGALFDHWSFSSVCQFVNAAHSLGMAVAVAGQLRNESLLHAAQSDADVVGVRGAVCAKGRTGQLDRARVEQVRGILTRNCAAPFPASNPG